MTDRQFVLRKLAERGTGDIQECQAVAFSFDSRGLESRASRMGLVPDREEGLVGRYIGPDGGRYAADLARADDPVVVAVLTAFDWHGGGGSPLYRFASWGGLVFPEGHREGLLREIDRDLAGASDDGELRRLRVLRMFVSDAALCPPRNSDHQEVKTRSLHR